MNNHLVKKTLQLMTVKEVSEILNVSRSAVIKIVKKKFPELVKNGVTTYLNETQVTAVKLEIGKGRTDLANVSEVSAVKTNLEKRMIVQQALLILNDEIEDLKNENNLLQLENKSLQIKLDEEKSWYSVKRIKTMGFLQNTNARIIWNPLKKWSIENNYQIKTIFDANYGNVKTYHKDAWSAVYGLDFSEVINE